MKFNGIPKNFIPSGSRLFQYLAMITGTLSITSCGMNFAWSSPTLPQLTHPDSSILITETQGSWLVVLPLIAAPFGSGLGANIINKIGRKRVILATSVPYFMHWIIIAYARSFTVLGIGRFIGGFANGLSFCALPVYLGEIADPQIRGLLGASCSVTVIFGSWLINVIGIYLSISATALVALVFPIVQLFTFIWMPESPYYLILKNKIDDARKSLQILKTTDDVEADLLRIKAGVEEQMENSGRLLDLFTVKSNRKAIYILAGLRGAQHFCGGAVITFYAKSIFQQAGGISPDASTIVYFSLQLIICFFSSAIVDKAGRRPLLIVSTIGSAMALFTQGVYFYIQSSTEVDTSALSYIPLIALIVFVILFSVGLQTIPILMLGELFPANVKAFAMFLEDLYFDILGTIASKYFQISRDTWGIHVPFFSFTLCAVLGLFFVLFFVPETKGKTLEEIQCNLKGKTPEKKEIEKTKI